MGSRHRLVKTRLIVVVSLLGLLALSQAWAGLADVLRVEIRPSARPGHYQVDVTLRHADEGRRHYANRWEIIGPDGAILATRVLAHPHVHEQPFTRGLANVKIPYEFTWIKVRAHDLVHGYGGREVTLGVPRR